MSFSAAAGSKSDSDYLDSRDFLSSGLASPSRIQSMERRVLPRMQENSPPTAIPNSGPAIISPVDISDSLFDWSDLLDFSVDETLSISFPETESGFESGAEPGISESPASEILGRVRKRDPRLVCSNFLAGRVPCACPELDAKMVEEEEATLPGKKRSRTVRALSRRPVQCQVPGCEVDITELKGYHKRHRVCLQCANASSVTLDGEKKRYCQQCGKFHPLPDFDEGKRSCRRKLERHNNRRRRKPHDSKQCIERESQHVILADDPSGDDDDDSGKGALEEREPLLEFDGHVSTLCSSLGSQKLSDEINADLQKQNSAQKSSPSSSENKNIFSSSCPTTRISFKLYDWNPAEFPRRLRLQIFQWLASMPVELEGYVRPGCTILTAFIAIPWPIWHKLLDEPIVCLKELISSPGNDLSGRGPMLIYLNDMIFRITRDVNSLVKIKAKDQSPRLHYVHPTCFVAGRPMEFVACGSNLLQSKLRFLISFSGRYLAYTISVSSLPSKETITKSFDHQLVKVVVPKTDSNLFGPAFIEVENQSGLSNFVPILVGDRETCCEMESLLQNSIACPLSDKGKRRLPCDFMTSRQNRLADFILDVGWLLKPAREQPLGASDVTRFNSLLKFLMENNNRSSVVLERVLCSLTSAISKRNSFDGVSNLDINTLQMNMKIAQSKLAVMPRIQSPFFQRHDQHVVSTVNTEIVKKNEKIGINLGLEAPVCDREVVMNVNVHRCSGEGPVRRTFLASRPVAVAVAAVFFCAGACLVVLHPHKLSLVAVTIRRCLFDL